MNKLILSTHSLIVICFLTVFALPPTFVFSENGNPCANHPLGQTICQRALAQQNSNVDRLNLNPQSIQQAQAVSQLGGNMNNAAGLTNTISNVGLSDISQNNQYLGLLLGVLSGFLQGNSSNIGSMFQNLGSSGLSQITNNSQNYYPTCNYSDYRDCIAPFLAPMIYNQSLSGMNNFGNMGNVSNIGGQMFGGYNVGAGNTGAGISSLLGMGGGNNSGIFGMFGGANNQNGSWLGTILTTIGALTGNSSLIMAGQVINTLSAMNQQNQAMNQQNQQNPNSPYAVPTSNNGTPITGTPNYTGDGQGANSTVKGDFSHVTAADLRPHLGSNYSDADVQAFVDAGRQHGIDPRFLASVSKFETGNGTSRAFTDGRNNAMGTSNSTGPIGFGSVRESIFAQANSLSRNGGHYTGASTIQQIGDIYSPSVNPATGKPYQNDVNGTNWSWAGNVSSNYNQMTNGSTGT